LNFAIIFICYSIAILLQYRLALLGFSGEIRNVLKE